MPSGRPLVRLLRLAPALALSAMLAACSTMDTLADRIGSPFAAAKDEPAAAAANATPTSEHVAHAMPAGAHTDALGVGDVVLVGQGAGAMRHDIGTDGLLKLADGTTVQAQGLTTAELSAALAKKGEPAPPVTVVSRASVFVYGAVRVPGPQPFVAGSSVADVIARAGGYTYRADLRRILIVSRGTASERAMPGPVVPGNTMGSPAAVAPGDVVRIPEAYF